MSLTRRSHQAENVCRAQGRGDVREEAVRAPEGRGLRASSYRSEVHHALTLRPASKNKKTDDNANTMSTTLTRGALSAGATAIIAAVAVIAFWDSDSDIFAMLML